MINYKKVSIIIVVFIILGGITLFPVYATAIDEFSKAIDTDGASDLKTEGR